MGHGISRPNRNIIDTKVKLDAENNLAGYDPDRCYNYAVIGLQNSGKSSLVNSIRGIEPNEEDAAPVLHRNCTSEVKRYCFREKYDYILIWDIPGAGTHGESKDAETYFATNGLLAFDCLIIMVSATLQAEELNYALTAVKNQMPVCFVRAFSDFAIEERMKKINYRRPPPITQKDVIEYLKEENDIFMIDLEKKDKSLRRVPYFFISNNILLDLMQKLPTPIVFMEKRFIDFLINTIKNQRHIIDENYEDYGLQTPSEESSPDQNSEDLNIVN